ncbi:MAG: hypothetical protein U0R66_00255 [Mycobacterium sp.]
MASHESSPHTLAARTRLADLIAEAVGELSDRDLAVLELSYRHGLEGDDLAAALEVSVAQARVLSQRLRQTIERSLGALLVARLVRRHPRACPELAETLSDWDGVFTARIRKRVTGHIDNCLICAATRRRLVTPTALLGAAPVLIPAPDWLRTQTLRRIRLADHDDDAGRGPRRSRAGVGHNTTARVLTVVGPAATRRRTRGRTALAGLIAILTAALAARRSVRRIPRKKGRQKTVTRAGSHRSYR